MNRTAVNRFFALLILSACSMVLCLPAVVSASPSVADSVHFCGFGHEEWRRDLPLPATKRLANLNAGEPRTVRMIYFLPNDWPYRADVVDSMKTVIRQAQTFYAEQMQAHGYGNWTFGIETDVQGEPIVHRVDGKHPFSHYDNTLGNAVVAELEEIFDLDANIYFIVLGTDALRQGNGRGAAGVGRWRTKNGGNLVVANSFGFLLVAHELGHTFGLRHDFRDKNYIMSYGPSQRRSLSACAAEYLAVHPHFNSDSSIEEESPPAIEIILPAEYPVGSKSVSVRFRVRDPAGVHQLILFVRGFANYEVKACRGVTGETDAVVEFEYDGRIPSDALTSLSDAPTHRIVVEAVDTDGNVRVESFGLAESSPYRIATVKGHSGTVNSVSFLPDSTKLVSGSWDRTVKLWDASTLAHVATLEEYRGATVVSFSPDGTIWATNTSLRTVKLWEVETRDLIGTLEAHHLVTSMSFSPDGTKLATGSWGTVKLWEVETRDLIGTLEGHSSSINSVSFSPDGATLASGSVRIVELWDVVAQDRIATLEEYGGVNSVSFSPDGATLASGAYDGTIKLWNVFTRENIAILPHTDIVNSVSFSPDGRTLASGGNDGTITLWDISKWTGPRPFAIGIVSGEGQQGAPGTVLAHPLVVEVRDQYGDPLPDVSVTFTVTEGDGKLSGRFLVEHATTDADGRAEILLTLGPFSGATTIGVSLGGRELAAFRAEGVGTAVAELEGDYRTWHLPDQATVRLGKGSLGQGDRAVAMSGDERYLAVASDIGVWLYEVATSRALALLPTESPVHSVAFSLDGSLAGGLINGQVELWEIETGTKIGMLRHADWGQVSSVVFSPNGKRLASGSSHQVKVWDIETLSEIGVWEVKREDDVLLSLSVVFSPDGKRLASGFQDGTVRLWDVATRAEVATLKGHTGKVTSVAFSPNGATLASAGGWRDPTVRLWDVATRAEVATLKGHTGGVTSVAFSPDGATLASGGGDSTVNLWDVATRTYIATLEGHTGPVHSVVFSSDGTTLVSGASDGTVLLRDVETGNVSAVSGHQTLTSMAWSPDGTTLASVGGEDPKVILWDVGSRVQIGFLKGHTDRVYSLSFSSDGATLAAGSHDNTVKLWDVGSRELVGMLKGHTDRVTSVEFSPNGAILASAGGWSDPTVRLWDVATRAEVATLKGHTDTVYSLSFSPDGATLASGGGDSTVNLWDVATRTHIATLEGHRRQVYSVAFSPDGNVLASGASDGTVLLWDMVPYIASPTPNPDFNGDGTVDLADFLLFADVFGLSRGDEGYEARYDLDGDGTIGINDFLIFAENFGKEST